MTNPFEASASALGYFYQVRLALFLLINEGKRRPALEITIEGLDDIVFEHEGAAVELIQSKFHIQSTASLTDRSEDLWKTLRVWSHHIKEGAISATDTLFTLFTTANAPVGSAASLLRHDPNRNTTVAREKLEQVAGEESNTANLPGYRAFMALTPSQRQELVSNIRMLDHAASVTNVMDNAIGEFQLVTRPQFLTQVYERVEGWWFNRVLKHLTREYQGSILFQELQDQVHLVQEQFQPENLPIDFSSIPDIAEDQLPEEERIFVEQLRLILVSEPRIQKAISDYYRAYCQRSKWVREDLLLVGELDEYEAKLVDEWERRFLIIQEGIDAGAPETIRQSGGKKLYQWVEMDLPSNPSLYIRPRCTESYVIRGSYHLLANRLEVGWHLDFAARLQHLLK
ncbi:MAG TPA: ABC-three component system protein [Armatimonadota bacterium]|jgi:hypothetical protein